MADSHSPNPRPRFGGGAPLALLTLAGVIIGGFQGQPSIGLLVGFGLGVVVALLIWRFGPR
jgi:uncharacterized protein YqgC (DUF456 family)